MQYHDFINNCKEQGVRLALPNPSRGSIDMLRYSSHVGTCLRQGLPLADKRLDGSLFPEDSRLTRDHITLINTSINPDREHPLSFAERGEYISHCTDAETKFSLWLDDLNSGRQPSGRILIDKRGAPIAVQKAVSSDTRYGEPSTLLLQDVVVGRGVRLPAGSLASMAVRFGVPKRESAQIIRRWQVYGMSFLRLSGFSLSGQEWSEYLPRKARNSLMNLGSATTIAADYVQSRKIGTVTGLLSR